MDDLTEIMTLQSKLQTILGNNVRKMTPKMQMEYIREQVLACTDELHEALQETGWKTWANNPHINRDAYRDELIDAFLFLLNLMNVVEVTPYELYTGYVKKYNNAVKRHAENYDGVSTKCPVCKRAYDNDAVGCAPGVCDAVTPDVPATMRVTADVPAGMQTSDGFAIGSSPRMHDTV